METFSGILSGSQLQAGEGAHSVARAQ